jgi:DNA-binding HxlR family transcriptional regulator
MKHLEYGQYCGLARALEVVGEPWSLLLVRDLLVSPKSSAELREGLPPIPEDELSIRLAQLERAGVVSRRSRTSRDATVTFELTDYGYELEDILIGLGRWGSRTLGSPRRAEIVTPESMVMALRTVFRPEAARGLRVTYLLHLGPIVLHARINEGHADIGKGVVTDADLIVEAGPALKALMAGEMSPSEAIETGSVRIKAPDGTPGDPALLAWFVEIFHIAPPPLACNLADSRVPDLAAVPEPELERAAELPVPAGVGG